MTAEQIGAVLNWLEAQIALLNDDRQWQFEDAHFYRVSLRIWAHYRHDELTAQLRALAQQRVAEIILGGKGD